MSEIERVHARQIVDSRGNPTVEVDVQLGSGAAGRAAPSVAAGGRSTSLPIWPLAWRVRNAASAPFASQTVAGKGRSAPRSNRCATVRSSRAATAGRARGNSSTSTAEPRLVSVTGPTFIPRSRSPRCRAWNGIASSTA